VIRRLTGKSQTGSAAVPGITANILNQHYASVSTDSVYQAPLRKRTAAAFFKEVITEFQVFIDLDHLNSTATGLDLLPAWFLRLGAPIFAKPFARLFNISLYVSFVPHQWKQARIHPVPKVSAPTQPADYRPISITPIITRVMERMVVIQYIYPFLSDPPPALTFTNQFAFRPTGSTTSAIISLLNHVTHMFVNNPYVAVIAIDFTKAFDTVR
jgi:Reverse transcriptase (RNA-dependent DNA polymerase)